MKIQKISGFICACLLVAGCNRSTSTSSRSSEELSSPPRAQQEPADSTLTPAGRDTNGTNRIYPDTEKTVPKPPDNTGINTRDRSEEALTPGDQGSSQSDREITRSIRKQIVGKDELSTTAKNVKIITQDGKVTLRGPVKDDTEQKAIAE